jgi:hypothetical protein
MTERQDLPVGLAGLLADAARAAKLPPVERWNPARCGAIDIRIARDGTWLHRGRVIMRPEIVRMFSTLLRREAGNFYLVTQAEKLRIRVDDAPFTAVMVEEHGAGHDQRLSFTTNVGDTVTADAAHPIRVTTETETGDPAPYLLVRAALEARIARPVFYRLAELAMQAPDDPAKLGVWSGGVFFTLGRTD